MKITINEFGFNVATIESDDIKVLSRILLAATNCLGDDTAELAIDSFLESPEGGDYVWIDAYLLRVYGK